MESIVILKQMCVILLLVAIGYAYYKKRVLDEKTSQRISRIVVDVTNPATIIATVLSGSITATHREVVDGFIVGILIYIALAIIGVVLPKMLGAKGWESKAYNLMTVYTNTGFIGIPLAKAILPDNAMIFIIIFNILNVIFFYTHGILVLGGKEKLNFFKIINTGSVMAVVSIVVYWFDLKLPIVLNDTIIHLGEANVFLSMMLLGASLARYDLLESLRGKRMWIYTVIRMIALPLISVFVLLLLPFSMNMIQAYVLMVAMPAGNLPMIMSEKEGYPTENLSKGIMVTTFVSFITVTFIMGLVL